ARHVRQGQVEQDDVVVVELAQIDTLFAEVRRVDVETLGFEPLLDRLRRRAIVFNQQNAHASPLLRPLGSGRQAERPCKTPWDNSIRHATGQWLTKPDSSVQAFTGEKDRIAVR